MINKNLYLTGFMGCGKSTIGRLLAQRLNYQFVDTDILIEQQTGRAIKDIFQAQGEACFRRLEMQTLAELAQKSGLVVSLGGGAVLAPQNREWLKKGVWIFLQPPLALIKRRIADDPKRPLLAQGWEIAERLYQKRLPLYHQARHIIHCNDYAPDFLCDQILFKVTNHENSFD